MSPFDKANVDLILNGHGDWFGAELLRLIGKADLSNRARLRLAFPEEVDAYQAWERGDTASPAPATKGVA